MYSIIYKAIVGKYNDGEITFEQANELNDLAYDKYITEKKATWKYRLDKWKKANDYDPKTGTVDVDGHRVKFEFNGGSKKRNIVDKAGSVAVHNKYTNEVRFENPNTKIYADKATFNTKHKDYHKFTMDHEKGHLIERNSQHMDPGAYDKDNQKRRNFILGEIEKGKLPHSHDRRHDEYRADDYAVAKNGPDSIRHFAKDYLRAYRKDKNRRYTKDEDYKDQEFINAQVNDSHYYMDLANKTNDPEKKKEYIIKSRHAYSRAKELVKDNDHKTSLKRERDGIGMRVKSATDGKIKKRDIKK